MKRHPVRLGADRILKTILCPLRETTGPLRKPRRWFQAHSAQGSASILIGRNRHNYLVEIDRTRRPKTLLEEKRLSHEGDMRIFIIRKALREHSIDESNTVDLEG
jgi:hypothetical protein